MAPSFMKSFKVLALLTLAATLSCGSPTNVTQATDGSTDSFIKVIKRNMQAYELFLPDYFDPILKAAIDNSHNKNEEFTKNFVAGMWDNNKNFNYIICRPSFTANFDGKDNVDWIEGHVNGFKKESYHIIIGGAGTFTRAGGKTGGFANWAWKGSVQKGQDMHSNIVKFVKPGSIGSDIESGGD
ncbi:hypothetical protein JOM56_011620 [Amanita muscaria]